MAINGSAGTKLYICASANPTATDASQYAALSWVEVKEVETIPEFGDAASAINFIALSDSRVRKLKGAYDAGQLTIPMAHDPNDAGQTDCATAALTPYSYAFKIVAADAPNASATDSVFYFQAKVMSFRLNPQGANNVTMRQLVLDIDTAITAVMST